MESELIFIFGSVKDVRTGSILIVDGNLAEGSQKTEGALGDVVNDFQIGQENAIIVTIDAIDMLALEIGEF
jgi:uridine phosphorylase